MHTLFDKDESTLINIKHLDENGHEYWLARELQQILNYEQWSDFENTINRAMLACNSNGYKIDGHFSAVNKTIDLPKGMCKIVPDYRLSRYACYLIVMNGQTLKIAAAYIRVSTDDQLEYSPDSQLKMIRDWGKQHGYIIPDEYVYIDEGISGRNTKKRKDFNEMLAVAKEKPKPFDAILLWKFSRFARNREDSIVYKSMLRRKYGIDVISITESIGDGKMSIITEAMIEAMDEFYSLNLAEEVQRGMTEKASRGEPVSKPPFGYSIKEGKFYPNNDAEFVKKAFTDYANGKGEKAIAMELSALGCRTQHGNQLDNRFVDYMLHNPVYIGKIRWSKSGRLAASRKFDSTDMMISDGKHEPIIEKELWAQVQDRLIETKKRYPKYQRPEQNNWYMLKGILRCSSCGATLIKISNKQKFSSFQCHNYARGRCHISHSIGEDKANRLVIKALEDSARTLNFRFEEKKAATTEKATDYEKLLLIEKRKLEKVKVAYEEGIDTLEEYKENKQRLTETINQLHAMIALEEKPKQMFDSKNYSKKVIDVINILRSSTASELEKNSAIRSIIHRIDYIKPEGELSLYFYR